MPTAEEVEEMLEPSEISFEDEEEKIRKKVLDSFDEEWEKLGHGDMDFSSEGDQSDPEDAF